MDYNLSYWTTDQTEAVIQLTVKLFKNTIFVPVVSGSGLTHTAHLITKAQEQVIKGANFYYGKKTLMRNDPKFVLLRTRVVEEWNKLSEQERLLKNEEKENKMSKYGLQYWSDEEAEKVISTAIEMLHLDSNLEVVDVVSLAQKKVIKDSSKQYAESTILGTNPGMSRIKNEIWTRYLATRRQASSQTTEQQQQEVPKQQEQHTLSSITGNYYIFGNPELFAKRQPELYWSPGLCELIKNEVVRKFLNINLLTFRRLESSLDNVEFRFKFREYIYLVQSEVITNPQFMLPMMFEITGSAYPPDELLESLLDSIYAECKTIASNPFPSAIPTWLTKHSSVLQSISPFAPPTWGKQQWDYRTFETTQPHHVFNQEENKVNEEVKDPYQHYGDEFKKLITDYVATVVDSFILNNKEFIDTEVKRIVDTACDSAVNGIKENAMISVMKGINSRIANLK